MEHPIRLLRIASVTDNRRGGMSRTMYCTGDHLQEMGFEVHYAFQQDFIWPVPRILGRFVQPWESAAVVSRANRSIGAFDLVELHEPLTIGYGVLRKLRAKTPKLIGFSYGLEDRGQVAMRSYQQAHGVNMRLKSQITSAVQIWQSTTGIHCCDHVVCSNQADVDYLADRGFAREHLTRHFTGVEQHLLDAGESAAELERKGLLFIGSWIDRKGSLDLPVAINEVLRRHPQWHFTIAGCQVEAAGILEQFAPEVQSRIRILPKINTDEELAELYSTHAVFVLPSYFEGQPLVMLEAAAFGMAIVTTPVCGMLDFIRDGENGMFVAVGQAQQLTEALSSLAGDPMKVRHLGSAARKSAIQQTWRKSAENLAEAYRKVLAR
jgi:glycosyltransferase involved in cell wall biosynthesis